MWWLLKRLHEKGLLEPRPPRAALLPALRHGALEPRARARLPGRPRPLGLRDLPARRRQRRASSSSGRRRRGRCPRTSRPRCTPSSSTASTRRRTAACSCARSRAPGRSSLADRGGPDGGPLAIGDLARRAVRRGAELVGLAYRRPLDVVPLPGRGSRAGRRRRATSSPPRTARASCTWRPPSAPTTTPRRSARARDRSARSPPTAPSAARSWPELEGRLASPTTRRTSSSCGGSSRTAAGSAPRAYEHSYPHCWRCRSQLIYYARDSWFVRTSAVKERMLELNRAGRLAPARGRRGPLRRVAREQRRLGALARPLLGHAAAGLGERPRPRRTSR